MLKGCDVSSWQSTSDWSASEFDFVICKATEGVTIIDSQAQAHYAKAKRSGLLTGFYHYARPESNSAQREAQYFVDAVRPYIGESILALDYEGRALAYGPEWALRWLNIVHEMTGVKPVIYLQGSAVSGYGDILSADYGLWVAHWGTQNPWISPWPFYTLWQYRGDPLDLDYFNGDAETWAKYAAVGGKTEKEKEMENFVELWKAARDEADPFYANLSDVPVYWRPEVEAMMKVGAIRGDGVNTVGKRRSELEALIPACRYVDWYFGDAPEK